MLKISIPKSLAFAVPAAAAFALSAVYAHAGLRTTVNVSVSSSGYAYGSLGSARNSSDTRQHIGCGMDTYASAVPTSIYCSAQDLNGNYVGCTSTNPKLVSAAAALNGDTYMSFYFDATGTCTEIYTVNDSYYAPKAL